MRNPILAVLIALTAMVSASADSKETIVTEATAADRDGYTLFSYSLRDAEKYNASNPDPTISVATDSNTSLFTYVEHVLSCGTHMSGSIKKTVEGSLIRYSGRFNVTKNDYGISSLVIDFVKDTSKKKRTGFIIVNERKIDINLI